MRDVAIDDMLAGLGLVGPLADRGSTGRRGGRPATPAPMSTGRMWSFVCGGSELAHKVSRLYTRDKRARGKLATAPRRGVDAIAATVVEHLALRR